MPLTFPAHQAFVVPLKLWKPRWFDGIALVVGSGSPDLFYAFGSFGWFESHKPDGVLVAVAFTITYSIVLRRFAIDGLFGALPDLGPLKARNYRVLANGRPSLLVTAFSAFIGVANHVFVDSFTHSGRTGANLLGLDRVLFELPAIGPISGAATLQYLGHTFGSLVGVLLFARVVSGRHLSTWYGEEAVGKARIAPLRPGAPLRVLATSSLGLLLGVAWGLENGSFPIFHVGFMLVMSLLVAGIVNQGLPLGSDPRGYRVTSGV